MFGQPHFNESPTVKQETLPFQELVALVRALKLEIDAENLLGQVNESDTEGTAIATDIKTRIVGVREKIREHLQDINVFCIQLETAGLKEEAELVKKELLSV